MTITAKCLHPRLLKIISFSLRLASNYSANKDEREPEKSRMQKKKAPFVLLVMRALMG